MESQKKQRPALKPFRINRDVWDDQGERHLAGGIAEFDPSEDLTIDMLESGIISRVK